MRESAEKLKRVGRVRVPEKELLEIFTILEQLSRFGMCESGENLISIARSGYAMEINFSPLSHIHKTLRLF